MILSDFRCNFLSASKEGFCLSPHKPAESTYTYTKVLQVFTLSKNGVENRFFALTPEAESHIETALPDLIPLKGQDLVDSLTQHGAIRHDVQDSQNRRYPAVHTLDSKTGEYRIIYYRDGLKDDPYPGEPAFQLYNKSNVLIKAGYHHKGLCKEFCGEQSLENLNLRKEGENYIPCILEQEPIWHL